MNAILRYKLAICYGVIFSIGTLASTTTVALEHVNFKDLQKEDVIVITAGIVSAWCTTMLAFVSNAMHKIPPDNNPK